jgi:hypothetical protein
VLIQQIRNELTGMLDTAGQLGSTGCAFVVEQDRVQPDRLNVLLVEAPPEPDEIVSPLEPDEIVP